MVQKRRLEPNQIRTGTGADDIQLGGGAAAAVSVPGDVMFGTLFDYPTAGAASAGDVQYLRLRLQIDQIVTGSRTFFDTGTSPARNVRMGLYDQADPEDPTGVPVNRLRQTASLVSSVYGDGAFAEASWVGGNYVVPITGYYWIAIVQDSASLKIPVSAVMRADFLPVYREASAGTTLPATVGAISNPASSVLFQSLVTTV